MPPVPICDGSPDNVCKVCATGFDVSFVPSFEMVGRKGVRIADAWRDLPDAYLGLSAPSFPNYFMISGPQGPLGNGSILPSVSSTSEKSRHALLTKHRSKSLVTTSPLSCKKCKWRRLLQSKSNVKLPMNSRNICISIIRRQYGGSPAGMFTSPRLQFLSRLRFDAQVVVQER